MYVPKHFEVDDEATLRAFIEANSFATLVSNLEGALFATHLPLLVESDAEGRLTLLGHVAAANQHQRAFDGQSEALAIFHGPHAYVSPRWYEAPAAVPTWNYAVVHAYGRLHRIDDPGGLAELVDRLTDVHDGDFAASDAVADLKARLLKGIVGFRMPVERLEGKFKLSQNRSAADRLGVIQALGDHPVAAMMQEALD